MNWKSGVYRASEAGQEIVVVTKTGIKKYDGGGFFKIALEYRRTRAGDNLNLKHEFVYLTPEINNSGTSWLSSAFVVQGPPNLTDDYSVKHSWSK